MNIRVLGPGCSNCEKLEKLVREVVGEMGLDAEVVKVKSMSEILQYRILMTPGLVIDEEVVCAGRVPQKSEIREIIERAATGK
jgi:small redox-active disulfide protein 2